MFDMIFSFFEKILGLTIDPFTFDFVAKIFDFILGK